VTFTTQTTFVDALETIHETIGCTEVVKKPDLTYQLSIFTTKSQAISLGSQDDWEGCLDDVAIQEKKKGVKVTVNIFVPELISTSSPIIKLCSPTSS